MRTPPLVPASSAASGAGVQRQDGGNHGAPPRPPLPAEYPATLKSPSSSSATSSRHDADRNTNRKDDTPHRSTASTDAALAKSRIVAPAPPAASPLLRVRILGQNPVFCHGVRALLDGRGGAPSSGEILQAHLGDDARAAAPDDVTVIAFAPGDDTAALRALLRRLAQERERARRIIRPGAPPVGTAPPVLLVDTAASAAGDRGAIESVERALTLVVAETDISVFLTAQDPVAAIAQSIAAAAAAVAASAESMPRCSPRLFGALLRAVRRHCAALPLQEVPGGNSNGTALLPALSSSGTTNSRAGLLTPREVEVARLIAFEGLTDTEIGERLGVSINTVRTHVAGLRRKLHVSARGKIAAALRRHLY